MRHTKSSWIANTSRILAATGSLIAAEAMGQEQPNNAPDKPVVTEEYRDQVMELMRDIRVSDDDKRLAGLRELETFLKPFEHSQLMIDTRSEIISVLTIQTLEKQLYSDNPHEAEAAADKLHDTWLQDERFYVRRQAKRVLDKKFADTPEADPRNRPPDVSEYINPMYNMKPVTKLPEWSKSATVQQLIQRIRHTAEKLEDPSYQTRVDTSKELWHALYALQDIVYPLPPEVLDTLRPTYNTNNWDSEWQSLEKRQRAERILRDLTYTTNTSRLPPMNTSVGQIIADIEHHFGMQIDTSAITFSLQHLPLETVAGTNDYSSLLVKICEATGTYPVCGGHIRHIKLVPMTEVEAAHVRVMSLDSAVAVVKQDTKDGADQMQLFMDPQLALLDLEAASYSNLPLQNANLSLLPDGEATWNVAHAGWEKPQRTLPMQAQASDEDTLTIQAWVAGNTFTQSVDLETFRTVNDGGPHNYNMRLSSTGDSWQVQLSMGMYDYLEWHETTHEEDTKTYAAAEAATVNFFDKDGTNIPAKRSVIHIDKRRGSILFSLPEKPTRAEVTTFRRIMQQEMRFPLNGDPKEVRIMTPNIAVD